ncbi:uncharacterized protein BJ212DRAFT_1483244 [Suillus subaureus]|uniref:BZIP domain-containing protein n=1 Tax=Suillus subaureus TaxID=48587 RepID=A0A9P7E5V4_9AGAM|nr:uncharacterized protein BJ212DRAFT_1483244 [Suillus subaureus]KAG1812054.1 hypothetical protein BJ212DRAFT_1483244 [Suillus subaureus]
MSPSHSPNFVDPSNLSLPSSSSLKRPASPSSSRADSPDVSRQEPPRKRPRSARHKTLATAEKLNIPILSAESPELEEENRRLRAGVPMTIPASPSVSSPPQSPRLLPLSREQERKRKRAEEQRERENLELRERIRTLEMGYEAVLRTLATQGANPSALHETSGSTPILSSTCAPSPASAKSPSAADSASPTPSSPKSTSLATLSYPLSPAPTHSTLTDSPMLFLGDSFDFPLSPAFSLSDLTPSDSPAPVHTPQEALDLSSIGHAPTRHLARVATTTVHAAVSLQRVGSTRLVMGPARATRCTTVLRSSLKTRQPQTLSLRACSQRSSRPRRLALALFQALVLRQKTRTSTQVLSEPISIEKLGLGLATSGINTANWAEQVGVEMGIERLLEILPSTQDVAIDSSTTFDVGMDFSDALVWDEVSVY